MKKLLIIILLFSYSCTTNEIIEEKQEDIDNTNYWKFGYKDKCEGETTGYICVPKDELDKAMKDKYYVNEICFKIRLKNTEGKLEFYIFSYSTNVGFN